MSFQNSELFELFRNSDNENAFKLAIVERLHDLPGYHEEDVKHIIHFAYLTIKKKMDRLKPYDEILYGKEFRLAK